MKSEIKSVKLGRPVNENSVRQLRLKELELKRSNGELKRGRPVVINSERQIRLAKQAINKANGIGQGRPINLNSARQIRLAELQAKRDLGICFRGRPKQIKGDEVAA
jgi:exonuclease VII small subunit